MSIHKVKWHHKIYGHKKIAIPPSRLWQLTHSQSVHRVAELFQAAACSIFHVPSLSLPVLLWLQVCCRSSVFSMQTCAASILSSLRPRWNSLSASCDARPATSPPSSHCFKHRPARGRRSSWEHGPAAWRGRRSPWSLKRVRGRVGSTCPPLRICPSTLKNIPTPLAPSSIPLAATTTTTWSSQLYEYFCLQEVDF